MPYNASGVVSSGFPQASDPFTFTYLLSGTFADDAALAAVAGKAVSLDTSAPNTVKLVANDEEIFGRVFSGAERRVELGIITVAVQRQFKEKLPAAPGHSIIVGSPVRGTGAGLIELAPAANGTVAVEVGTDYAVVEKFS